MKKLILLMIICTSINYSQWERVLPYISEHQVEKFQIIDSINWIISLYRIDFVRPSDDGKYFIKTEDGGDTWKEIFSIDQYNTHSYFVNKDIGYIAFNYGPYKNHLSSFIYKTVNGGKNWITLDNHNKIDDVIFFDENIGIGNSLDSLFKTYDGGLSWIKLKIDSINVNNIKNFHGKLYSSNGHNLYVSQDTANSWTKTTFDFDIADYFFDSKEVGYISGHYGELCKTVDGGKMWMKIRSSKLMYSQNKLLFYGKTGFIIYSDFPHFPKSLKSNITNYEVTTDGGYTWELFYDKFIYNYHGLKNGFALNDSTFIFGTYPVDFVKTTDKGKTFKSINYIDSSLQLSYSILDDNNFLVKTSYALYYTSNSGKSFNKAADLDSKWIYHLYNGTKYILRRNKSTQELFISYDTCKTWLAIDNKRWSRGVRYIDGYFYSHNGIDSLFRSQDGLSWSFITECISYKVYKTNFLVIGRGKNFYKSYDNGNTFELILYNKDAENYALYSNISIADENNFTISTSTGIFSTQDGGLNYFHRNFDYDSNVEFSFMHNNQAYHVFRIGIPTNNPVSFFTSDDNCKTLKDFGYGSGLTSTFIKTTNTLWGYSDDGALVKLNLFNNTLNTSKQKDNKEMASSFTLSQNYPNPFNPTTNIEYKIPTASYVTLKVYSLLGEEVASLINEEKASGSYTVLFEAKSLSTGIYFYVIRAGDYNDTKKMILLK